MGYIGKREVDSPSIQIILLDINTVNGGLAESYVAISDVRDETRSVEVGFYTRSILGIDDNTIREL